MSSKEEKTEHPTEYKIKKEQKRGNYKSSKELNYFLLLLVGLGVLFFLKMKIVRFFFWIFYISFVFDRNVVDDNIFFIVHVRHIFECFIDVFFSFFVFLVAIVFISPIFLSGFFLQFYPLKLDFNRLNFINGIKNIFNKSALYESFKMILKVFLFSFILGVEIFFYYKQIINLSYINIDFSFIMGFHIFFKCCEYLILGILPVVILDVVVEYFSYYKKIRMSHQEVREEFKQIEGNPLIKNRIKQKMRMQSRRRILKDVKLANVIIANPVHYSICLRYKKNHMEAPKVIAKGSGLIALKIQEIAKENFIPIFFSPILAKILYKHGTVGKYIPFFLYKSIAEVLAWVWKIKKWKKKGGLYPKPPKNIWIPKDLNF